jgi:hypothetical protein
MIIKSMSRKQATFSQLVDYFEDGRQDAKYSIYHNIYSTNAEAIKEEFTTNANFLPKRKNGVYMYHEILSITDTGNLNREQQKEILKDVGLEYIQNRASKNLVYAVLHDDKKDNLHYHFMISSNELMSEKRLRLSKEQFSKIKKDLELKVLEKYPELEQKKLINKEVGLNKDSGEKLSSKGVELKRRTGKTSQRDDLKDRLTIVFEKSKNKADFFELLEKENLSIYVNGNTIGILDKATDRKHRLKTLGMLDQFNAISQIIESSEEKKQQAEDVKINSNTVNKEFSKERINTSSYNKHQGKPATEEKATKENTTTNTVNKEFSKEKINTNFSKQEEKPREENPKPNTAEEVKSKEKPSNHYTDKMSRQNNDDSEKKQDRRNIRSNYNQDRKSQEDKKHQHSRDESRYSQRKDETLKPKNQREAYKPKSESDLKRTKQDDKGKYDKGKYQERTKKDERVKTDRTRQSERKRDEQKRDYKRKDQQEKSKTTESKSEVELEIERRKQQLKKERENEADYSNDYSKGR